MKYKTALVLGSSGSIGSEMVRQLEQAGTTVYTCDPASGGDVITDLPRIDNRFDLVVHCAANVGGRRAIEGLPMNLAKNAMIDGTVFDWAVRTRQPRVLYFSGAEAYPVRYQNPSQWGTGELMKTHPHGMPGPSLGHIPLSEDMIDYERVLQPDGPHGWAKMNGELMAQAAIASGIRVFIFRPFTGYGYNDRIEHPFANIIFQAKSRTNKNVIEVWGSADSKRDWILNTDIVRGALAVVNADFDFPFCNSSVDNPGTAVNLCTGEATSFRKLIGIISKITRVEYEIKENFEMPQGVLHRVGDSARMSEFYVPRFDLDQTIRRAIAWRSRA